MWDADIGEEIEEGLVLLQDLVPHRQFTFIGVDKVAPQELGFSMKTEFVFVWGCVHPCVEAFGVHTYCCTFPELEFQTLLHGERTKTNMRL